MENFAAEQLHELLRLEVRQWSVLTPGRISQLIIPQLTAPTVTHSDTGSTPGPLQDRTGSTPL